MNWVGFSQGVAEGRESDTRKRQEMAQAFADYRASNPYATAAEFQDFIDRYSGGRNYIAGGAPSSAILRAIGLENQKKKAGDEMRQRLADIQTRQQTLSSLQNLADEYLLGMEGDDFATARDEFTQQFGPEGAAMLGEFNLNGMFTPTRRNIVVGKAMREFLPGAIELARTSKGKITSADIAKAYPGIPSSLLDPLLTEAKRVADQELADAERAKGLERANAENTIRSSLLQNPAFQAAIRMGDQQAAKRIIATTLKPYQPLFEGAFGDDFVTGVIDEQVEVAQALQLTEHQKLYGEAQTRQQEAIKSVEGNALASVNNAFRAGKDGQGPSSLAGQAGAFGLFAAQELAKVFDTSKPEAIDALAGLFALDDSKGKTTAQLIQEGAAALTAAGVPPLEFSKQQAAMARGLNLPEMQSFPQWKSTTEADIRADIADFDKEVTRIASLTDPQQMRIEMSNVAQSLDLLRQAYLGAIQDARINQTLWIPAGEQGWDDAQVIGPNGSVVATLDAEIGKLNEKLNNLSQMALELEARGQQPDPAAVSLPDGTPAPAPTGEKTGQTAFARQQDYAAKATEADAALKAAERVLYMGEGALPAAGMIQNWREFFTEEAPQSYGKEWSYSGEETLDRDAARTRANGLMKYLRLPEARTWALEDPANLQLLKSDPIKAAIAFEKWLEKNGGAQGGGVSLPRG